MESTEVFEKNLSLDEYLGARRLPSNDGVYRYVFRLFEPDAKSVYVLGDFNSRKMLKTGKIAGDVFEGFFESDIPIEGMRYKYRVEYRDHTALISDPFAKYYESNGERSSIIYTPDVFDRQDGRFMSERKRRFSEREAFYCSPLNIYELHLASWQTLDGRSNASSDACLNYREIAEKLSKYISSAGYTHIELISPSSNDLFPNKAYAGLFAPSSLFGTPDDFKSFVDTLHRAGIGVIADLAVDCSYPDTFVSAALFWMREFHIDGLKIDCPHEESEGLSKLFVLLNKAIKTEFPDVMTILGNVPDLENATTGGLGFTFRWNYTFGDNILDYLASSPEKRNEKYAAATAAISRYSTENFIIEMSHERMKNGKKSLIDKFFGTYSEKFATAKAFFVYMMSAPGKKLLFMGSEFGQLSEWDPENQLEWFMTGFDFHGKLQKFVFDLNRVYKDRRELWEIDFSSSGFSWVVNERAYDNVIAYERNSESGRLLFVFNFSPERRKDYGIPCGFGFVFYREIFNTDLAGYGGDDISNRGLLTVRDGELVFDLPPLSALVFEPFEPKFDDLSFDVIKN